MPSGPWCRCPHRCCWPPIWPRSTPNPGVEAASPAACHTPATAWVGSPEQAPGEQVLTLARMARPAPPPRVSEHHPQRDTSMFLLSLPHGSLVEVLQPAQLYNPFSPQVEGRLHAGEELQDPEPFAKNELRFPSGETLPRCWLDPSYSHPVLNSSR